MHIVMRDRHRRRLDRQFGALSRAAPVLDGVIAAIQNGWGPLVRLPLALTLISGGLLSFLPILGLWMLPLGVMVLAIDLPRLRPVVSASVIRLRRRWSVWRRSRRSRSPTGARP